MKNYKITVYFNDKINIKTCVTSEQDFDDFRKEINAGITNPDKQFLTFWEEDKSLTINKSNILFYVIEQAENKEQTKINCSFDLGSMF